MITTSLRARHSHRCAAAAPAPFEPLAVRKNPEIIFSTMTLPVSAQKMGRRAEAVRGVDVRATVLTTEET